MGWLGLLISSIELVAMFWGNSICTPIVHVVAVTPLWWEVLVLVDSISLVRVLLVRVPFSTSLWSSPGGDGLPSNSLIFPQERMCLLERSLSAFFWVADRKHSWLMSSLVKPEMTPTAPPAVGEVASSPTIFESGRHCFILRWLPFRVIMAHCKDCRCTSRFWRLSSCCHSSNCKRYLQMRHNQLATIVMIDSEDKRPRPPHCHPVCSGLL